MDTKKLWFDNRYAYLQIEDGTIGKLPLSRSPRLANASAEELNDFRFMLTGVHWNKLDEDIRFDTFFDLPPHSVAELLGALPDYLSMSYIAQRFYGKSRSWLHNKLRGNKSNNKPSSFTLSEKEQLRKALFAISDEIRQSAEMI